MSGILNDKQLLFLCIDDGHTFVDEEGVVHTDDLNAPKLPAIKEYLREQESLLDGKLFAKTPLVRLASKDTVKTMLELVQTLMQEESNSDEQSEIGVKLIELCQAAIDARASDIHVEVHRQESHFYLRVDGKREELITFANGECALRQNRDLGLNLAAYVFQMKGSHNFSGRIPINDRFELPLLLKEAEKMVEWRIALMPLVRGIKLVFRCLTPLGEPLTLDAMDLLPTQIRILKSTMKRRSGIIVLTGPMGSGKSSMVYALLDTVDRVARCCHALEDPVEFEQVGVTKTLVEPRRELKEGSGVYLDYTFYALEQLRQDIDITSFGELRSHNTTKEFTRKGETGGLALSTLHANSAIGVPAIFIEQLNIAPSIVSAPELMQLFSHQKLIRKLCQHCALSLQEAAPVYHSACQDELYRRKNEQLSTLLPDALDTVRLKHPHGCTHCSGKGEKERLIVLEIIALEDDDRAFIKAKDYLGWKYHLESKGWPDIRVHTLHRIRLGQIDIESASEQVDGLMPELSREIYQKIHQEMMTLQSRAASSDPAENRDVLEGI
ncbi:exonuclease SbcC [Vibrio sp. MACH09]|uniref:ATPase, T2SS/T4P/T4SS family n=1 Tax=Vibrio sp. MACH09 TaxID=3025122 RepID=UPI00279271A0|nr:ATPase, T2SS/T4P/T4SS family [Vibrio sp. MACH09]GLO64027.1 exonuclease SbcC [Vibrio sp. MACH09]